MDLEKLLLEFENAVVKQHEYTKSGDWKKGNIQTDRIAKTHAQFISMGEVGKQALLQLTRSNRPELALMAAIYSMRYRPEQCLEVLRKLSSQEIPHISFTAKIAIDDWSNNDWNLD